MRSSRRARRSARPSFRRRRWRPRARRTVPAAQVISPQVCFLMNDIMKDVITRGTGRRALALGRADLRGKTGTTNEYVDTWFNGFNDSLVASVWVGRDDPVRSAKAKKARAPRCRSGWTTCAKHCAACPRSRAPFPKASSRLKVNALHGWHQGRRSRSGVRILPQRQAADGGRLHWRSGRRGSAGHRPDFAGNSAERFRSRYSEA